MIKAHQESIDENIKIINDIKAYAQKLGHDDMKLAEYFGNMSSCITTQDLKSELIYSKKAECSFGLTSSEEDSKSLTLLRTLTSKQVVLKTKEFLTLNRRKMNRRLMLKKIKTKNSKANQTLKLNQLLKKTTLKLTELSSMIKKLTLKSSSFMNYLNLELSELSERSEFSEFICL